MFGGMERKELTLVYAVFGFGSVALVALGELSNVDAGSPLFSFYLNLVFGGLAVFYSVFVHFVSLSFSRKMDQKKKRKFTRIMLGARASYLSILLICGAVLVFWIYNFSQLMKALDISFF